MMLNCRSFSSPHLLSTYTASPPERGVMVKDARVKASIVYYCICLIVIDVCSGLKVNLSKRQISSAVMEVQEVILQQEPRLAKAMIPVPTLHITLLVTHLANQEQVDLWVDANTSIPTYYALKRMSVPDSLSNIHTHTLVLMSRP